MQKDRDRQALQSRRQPLDGCVREAFRLNKSILYEQLEQQEGTALLIALIWIDDKLWPTSEVEK